MKFITYKDRFTITKNIAYKDSFAIFKNKGVFLIFLDISGVCVIFSLKANTVRFAIFELLMPKTSTKNNRSRISHSMKSTLLFLKVLI